MPKLVEILEAKFSGKNSGNLGLWKSRVSASHQERARGNLIYGFLLVHLILGGSGSDCCRLMAVILARLFLFLRIVPASIAAKFASTFCCSKANLVSICSFIKAKRGRFLNWYKTAGCLGACGFSEACRLAGVCKLMGAGGLAGTCRIPGRIIGAWRGVSATTNPATLPCWPCALVIGLCERISRAISSRV